MTYRLTFARTLALTSELAYDAVLRSDLRRTFDRRYGVLAPVASFEVGPGWGRVGGTREVRASDGSTFLETLTDVQPATLLASTLSAISGPLHLIANHVEVTWTFDAHPDGARVAWCWDVTPPNRLAARAESLFRPQWSRYAGRALGRLEMAGQDRARQH